MSLTAEVRARWETWWRQMHETTLQSEPSPMLNKIVSRDPDHPYYGWTLLHLCALIASEESLTLARFLIEKCGVNPNFLTGYGWTPLDIACQVPFISMIEYLSGHPQVLRGNVLHAVCSPRKVSTVERSLAMIDYVTQKLGVSVHARMLCLAHPHPPHPELAGFAPTAAEWIVMLGGGAFCAPILKKLLSLGASEEGLLELACQWRNREAVEFLLERRPVSSETRSALMRSINTDPLSVFREDVTFITDLLRSDGTPLPEVCVPVYAVQRLVQGGHQFSEHIRKALHAITLSKDPYKNAWQSLLALYPDREPFLRDVSDADIDHAARWLIDSYLLEELEPYGPPEARKILRERPWERRSPSGASIVRS